MKFSACGFSTSQLQANTSTASCYQRFVFLTKIQPIKFLGTNADNNTDEEDTVHFYLTVFGWLQIFCLLVAPVIGQVLDKDLSLAIDDPQHGDKSNDDDVIYRRVQSLRNTRNAYMITQVCLHSQVPSWFYQKKVTPMGPINFKNRNVPKFKISKI